MNFIIFIILCRILSIVDAYDAMISDRPYRKAMSKAEAIDEIKDFLQFNLILENVRNVLNIIKNLKYNLIVKKQK